jgi:hypothetical protein
MRPITMQCMLCILVGCITVIHGGKLPSDLMYTRARVAFGHEESSSAGLSTNTTGLDVDHTLVASSSSSSSSSIEGCSADENARRGGTLSPAGVSAEEASKPPRPHIIMAIFDDAGANDIGSFSGGIHSPLTPFMDSLMAVGIKVRTFAPLFIVTTEREFFFFESCIQTLLLDLTCFFAKKKTSSSSTTCNRSALPRAAHS